MNEFEIAALEEAKKSPCKKRKVGCVIVDIDGNIVGQGHNYNPLSADCEDSIGNTHPEVVHAEIAALDDYMTSNVPHVKPLTAFVTQPPCDDCLLELTAKSIHVHVVKTFMKFDDSKDRYELIPSSALNALAKVLTYGAHKYKPNNWKECTDLDRYIGATMRHFEAYRAGEFNDPESGMPHLWHALTNLAFLVELDNDNTD